MKDNSKKSIENLQSDIDDITKSINLLIIERLQLKKTLLDKEVSDSKEIRRSNRTSVTRHKNKDLNVGDLVRITSNHKGRRGKVGRISGYKGSTQYKVDIIVACSSVEAEEAARKSSIKRETVGVWKTNVEKLKYKYKLENAHRNKSEPNPVKKLWKDLQDEFSE